MVFGGKEYVIKQHETVEEVFGKQSLVQNARRQLQLKFDNSVVVVNSRTLALVNAVGCTSTPQYFT